MARVFKSKMPALPAKRAPKSTTSGAKLSTMRIGTKRKR